MFASVRRIQNLKDLKNGKGSLLRKGRVLGYVASIQNLKDLKDELAQVCFLGGVDLYMCLDMHTRVGANTPALLE